MKKLLLGAMMAALFMGNAEGRSVNDSLSSIKESVTDTARKGAEKAADVGHNLTHHSAILKKSRQKNAENDVFTQNMGTCYQPTLRAINANLGGWINVIKNSEKDDKYSLAKTDIKHFRQTLEAVYEFTTAVSKKKTKVDRLSADAEGALNTFTKEKLNSFLNTTYGMDNLPYLTSFLAQINNALMTLVYTEERVSIGGIVWTSEDGSDFKIKSEDVNAFITTRSYKPKSQISKNSQVKGVWEAFNNMLKAWEKQRKVIKNAKQDDGGVNTKRDREANIDDDEDVSSKKRQKVSKRSRSVETETEEGEPSSKRSRKSLRESKSMNDISDSKENRRSLRKSRSMSDFDD